VRYPNLPGDGFQKIIRRLRRIALQSGLVCDANADLQRGTVSYRAIPLKASRRAGRRSANEFLEGRKDRERSAERFRFVLIYLYL
jgi:hypothetical protein